MEGCGPRPRPCAELIRRGSGVLTSGRPMRKGQLDFQVPFFVSWSNRGRDFQSSSASMESTRSNAGQAQFEADARPATIAPLIATASGSFGTNAEYVFKLQRALADCGMTDAYIEQLAAELTRHGATHGQ
ncbi:hypothetical protein GNZ11_11945 [Paraburkholderia xenovorans]|nr:hypothetical protein [Paraburkholderia xenovorans]